MTAQQLPSVLYGAVESKQRTDALVAAHDDCRVQRAIMLAPGSFQVPLFRVPRCNQAPQIPQPLRALCYMDCKRHKMSIRNIDREYGSPHPHRSDQQPIRPGATDQEVQKWILRQHGFVPESGWLLHCKELFGLAAPGTARKENPCPRKRRGDLRQLDPQTFRAKRMDASAISPAPSWWSAIIQPFLSISSRLGPCPTPANHPDTHARLRSSTSARTSNTHSPASK